MMLKPSISQILKDGESCYSLVIAIAKRAREISEEAEENHEIIVEKPVQLAVEDFASGKYQIVESDKIGQPED